VVGQEVDGVGGAPIAHRDSIQLRVYLLLDQRKEGRFLPRLQPGVSAPNIR
jgi:hypothetical protein